MNENSWSMPGDFKVTYNGTTYTSLASYQTASGMDANSINENPLFVNPYNGDFHSSSDSPLIDAGTLIQPGLTDRDGLPVPVGDAVDIGCYEYHVTGDFDEDYDVDLEDLRIFASHWLQDNCDPVPLGNLDDDCDVDIVDFAIFAQHSFVGK